MKRFMAKVSKSFKGGQKGFTLIELLIVIVILGVLAAAIVPNLSKFLGSGTVGAANAELASVRTAIAAYQADNYGDIPLGTSPAIDNALIQPYIAGSSTIKATYSVGVTVGADDYGVVVDGDPGDPASATAWGPTITFNTTLRTWEKTATP